MLSVGRVTGLDFGFSGGIFLLGTHDLGLGRIRQIRGFEY